MEVHSCNNEMVYLMQQPASLLAAAVAAEHEVVDLLDDADDQHADKAPAPQDQVVDLAGDDEEEQGDEHEDDNEDNEDGSEEQENDFDEEDQENVDDDDGEKEQDDYGDGDESAEAEPVKQPSVINLCDEDGDEDNVVKVAYLKSVENQLSRKRRKLAPAAVASSSPHGDAIDIDEVIHGKRNMNAAQAYKQALGPMRCDFCQSLGHHSYASQQPQERLDAGRLYKELVEYKLNLPIELSSSIFCRVLESRLDLLRVMITGPEGTPYANGCFLFDVYMRDYPIQAPMVKLLTTGGGKVRFNPNLYNCGKVCLSLLGTWSGPGWVAKQSTLLQVLVSIQGLILVQEPYYNEPGYENSRHDPSHQLRSQQYTTSTRQSTLQYAIHDFLDEATGKKLATYPEFANVVAEHFLQRAQAVREQVDTWAAADPTLKDWAKIIRQRLDKLEAMHANVKPAAVAMASPTDVVEIL